MAALSIEPTSRARLWACRLALIAITLVALGRLLAYDYVQWDDPGTIFENPDLVHVSMQTFVDAWTTPHMAIFIPVTHTIWAVLAAFAGADVNGVHHINAVPFRVLSLALHCGSTLIVFGLVRRISGSVIGALLGAAIFAVHPIQVETLGWISGEKDLLAGFFMLAAMTTAIRAMVDDVPRKSIWTLATLLLAILAMLSKPQAVVVLPIIAVALRSLAVPWRRAITFVAPLALPAIVVVIIARTVQPAVTIPDTAVPLRPIIVLDSLGWYLRKLIWPTDLTLDYGHTPRVALAWTGTYAIAAIVAAIIAIVWFGRRRWPLVACGLAIACAGPLPVLGLTKFDFQYYSTVADHYVYTGMMGIALVVAAVYRAVPKSAARPALFILLVPLIALTFRQAGVWRGTDELFRHNMAVNAKALGPTRVLAFRAANNGDDLEAIRLLNITLQTYPNDAMANYNLANALVRLGRSDEALPAFERAIAAVPPHPGYRHNYAIELIRHGRLDEAEMQLRQAIEQDPSLTETRNALNKLQALRAQHAATQPTGR